MSFSLTPVRLGLLTAIVALQACDSSSDSDPAIRAQAVDGYIVAANVSCDSVETGNATAAAGRFTCPSGTLLMSITGGQDVGFDPEATEGGTPFTGELIGPGSLKYVTPLSTLAVAMSSDEDGNYDPSEFEMATQNLARAFSQSSLDLSKDPATTLQISQLNAQVHEILLAFAETPESYAEAVGAFAAYVNTTVASSGDISLSLSENASTILEGVNAQLITSNSEITISSAQLEAVAAIVQANNTKYAAATDVDSIDRVSKEEVVEQAALTLDRDRTSVSFLSSGARTRSSISDFEDQRATSGQYKTMISTALTGITYDRNFVKVNRDLNNAKVSIGFEMKATGPGDQRSLSYITHDARFTAREGNPGSLKVSIPENARLLVTSSSRDGTKRNITIQLEGDHAFSNSDNAISVNNGRVREELRKNRIDDVLNANGNYEVTFAIGGLRVNSTKGGVARANGAQTIEANRSMLSGTGVKGYITVVDAN